eukprot:TRINITY_DN2098_c0_g4_i1.p1 TRINITY_DN2098_c0_g4~~TRINITY_DN2098_c0_g4_i1.p1  ORF type:complete len:1087 (+),score=268.58 TRINITY_DN2098_c0_g4_i1:312-3263(+)
MTKQRVTTLDTLAEQDSVKLRRHMFEQPLSNLMLSAGSPASVSSISSNESTSAMGAGSEDNADSVVPPLPAQLAARVAKLQQLLSEGVPSAIAVTPPPQADVAISTIADDASDVGTVGSVAMSGAGSPPVPSRSPLSAIPFRHDVATSPVPGLSQAMLPSPFSVPAVASMSTFQPPPIDALPAAPTVHDLHGLVSQLQSQQQLGKQLLENSLLAQASAIASQLQPQQPSATSSSFSSEQSLLAAIPVLDHQQDQAWMRTMQAMLQRELVRAKLHNRMVANSVPTPSVSVSLPVAAATPTIQPADLAALRNKMASRMQMLHSTQLSYDDPGLRTIEAQLIAKMRINQSPLANAVNVSEMSLPVSVTGTPSLMPGRVNEKTPTQKVDGFLETLVSHTLEKLQPVYDQQRLLQLRAKMLRTVDTKTEPTMEQAESQSPLSTVLTKLPARAAPRPLPVPPVPQRQQQLVQVQQEQQQLQQQQQHEQQQEQQQEQQHEQPPRQTSFSSLSPVSTRSSPHQQPSVSTAELEYEQQLQLFEQQRQHLQQLQQIHAERMTELAFPSDIGSQPVASSSPADIVTFDMRAGHLEEPHVDSRPHSPVQPFVVPLSDVPNDSDVSAEEEHRRAAPSPHPQSSIIPLPQVSAQTQHSPGIAVPSLPVVTAVAQSASPASPRTQLSDVSITSSIRTQPRGTYDVRGLHSPASSATSFRSVPSRDTSQAARLPSRFQQPRRSNDYMLSEFEMEKLLIVQQQEIDALTTSLWQRQRDLEAQKQALSGLTSDRSPAVAEVALTEGIQAALPQLASYLVTRQDKMVAQLLMDNAALKSTASDLETKMRAAFSEHETLFCQTSEQFSQDLVTAAETLRAIVQQQQSDSHSLADLQHSTQLQITEFVSRRQTLIEKQRLKQLALQSAESELHRLREHISLNSSPTIATDSVFAQLSMERSELMKQADSLTTELRDLQEKAKQHAVQMQQTVNDLETQAALLLS